MINTIKKIANKALKAGSKVKREMDRGMTTFFGQRRYQPMRKRRRGSYVGSYVNMRNARKKSALNPKSKDDKPIF